jgi:heat shock protein HslJ
MPRSLLLTGFLALCCLSCTPAGMEPRASRAVAPATTDPAAMTYRSTWTGSGEVTLTGGVYREPAAPGSAAELVVRLSEWQAFGEVDGQSTGAVILITESGGSGTFYELALLRRRGGDWVNSDVLLLGDRVIIHELAVRDGQVVVAMTTHGPQESMCCPTRRVERRYAVAGGALAAAGETLLPALPALIGPVWQWVRTFYNDDSEAVPVRPEAYTVTFGAGGLISVRADCNRKGGTYRLEDQALAIDITYSTKAMCPEDSLEDRFVHDLAASAIWFLKDGELYIDLKYDTGTMRFTRQP